MATPENTFIASVHRHLPVGLYHMKNHNQFNGGIPDVWYSGLRSDLWVEYKFVILPKRPNTLIVPELSELQKNWLQVRRHEGRNVSVITGCKEGGVVYNDGEWVQALTADIFKSRIQSRVEIARYIARLVS